MRRSAHPPAQIVTPRLFREPVSRRWATLPLLRLARRQPERSFSLPSPHAARQPILGADPDAATHARPSHPRRRARGCVAATARRPSSSAACWLQHGQPPRAAAPIQPVCWPIQSTTAGRNALNRFVTWVVALLQALNDPTNGAAHAGVAAVLLAAEAVLCLVIIRRVPCAPALGARPAGGRAAAAADAAQHFEPAWADPQEGPSKQASSTPRPCPCRPADTEIDWVAYMQEVGGYLKVRAGAAGPGSCCDGAVGPGSCCDGAGGASRQLPAASRVPSKPHRALP